MLNSVWIKPQTFTCPIGKVTLDPQKLYENIAALMDASKKANPSAVKGIYIRNITITSTMGPGIKKVDANQAQSMQVGE